MTNARRVLFAVYISISVATFYHSTWGFATMSGAEPHVPDYAAIIWWWLLGAMMAIAVDAGIGVIVWLRMQKSDMAQGWFPIAALLLLGIWSAYGQLIYSANHAVAYQVGDVADWLRWLQTLLDARVLVNPLVLPLFAILTAFIAKGTPAAKHVAKTSTADKQKALPPAPPVNVLPQWRTPAERRAIVRQLKDAGHSNAEIAKMLDVKPYTVTKDLKQNGKA